VQKELNDQRIAKFVIVALRSGAVDYDTDSLFLKHNN